MLSGRNETNVATHREIAHSFRSRFLSQRSSIARTNFNSGIRRSPTDRIYADAVPRAAVHGDAGATARQRLKDSNVFAPYYLFK